MIVLNRTFDPARKQFWRADVEYAGYVIRSMAAMLASHGPGSLDEPSPMVSAPEESADQIPRFDRRAESMTEWKNALAFVSELTATGVALVFSTNEQDPSFSNALAIVDLLSCVQRRIVEVLELGIKT
jgi:hypothetical protein